MYHGDSMKAALLSRGDAGRGARLQDVDDVIAGARGFISAAVKDLALRQLLLKAIAGLELQIEDEKELLPFAHLPAVIYAAIRGDAAPARPLAVATTLLFLGIDVLDDIADGDLPEYWQDIPTAEIQLVAATLLSSLPQLAISQLRVVPHIKDRMQATLSEGLLCMSGGQLQDLRGADRDHITPEDVEKSVEHKSGEEGALIAKLAADMAGVSEETAQRYAAFGRAIATGGQIATDCYDLFQAKHSKDLANGSRTLPVAVHLSRLEGADRTTFLSQLEEAKTSGTIRTLIQRELRAKGVLRLCALVVEMHCQKARDILAALDISAESRQEMDRMVSHVSFFSNRKSDEL